MIGTHYPLAFATRFNWVILALIIIIGTVIRHFYNERHAHRPSPWWTWGLAVALALAIVWLSTLGPAYSRQAAAIKPVTVAENRAEEIIITRCSMCHARQPVWLGLGSPPKGVAFDDLADMRRHARQIGLQAVWTHAMPPANLTGITAEERMQLGSWLAEGATIR